jgi:adenosylcobyric acid synthase
VLGGPGWLGTMAGQEVEGYEIHLGRTKGGRPWLEIHRPGAAAPALSDGAVSDDGRVWGCYLHGLFANPALRRLWLASLPVSSKEKTGHAASGHTAATLLHASLDRLADAVEAALDLSQVEAILNENGPKEE